MLVKNSDFTNEKYYSNQIIASDNEVNIEAWRQLLDDWLLLHAAVHICTCAHICVQAYV